MNYQQQSCQECGHNHVQENEMPKHNPVACPLCDVEFASKQKLKLHIENKVCQKKKVKIFDCPSCGKELASKDSLNKHIKICKGKNKAEAPYQCNLCGTGFYEEDNYNHH